MYQRNNKGLTLIELLVSIIILIVFSAIAFLSYKNVVKNAKDTKMVTDLVSVKDALDTKMLMESQLPMPNNQVNLVKNLELFGYQGEAGMFLKNVAKIKSDFLDADGNPYIYNVNKERNKFVLSTFLNDTKSDVALQNNINPGEGFKMPFLVGDNIGVLYENGTGNILKGKDFIDIGIDKNYFALINSNLKLGTEKIIYLEQFYVDGMKQNCFEYINSSPFWKGKDGKYLVFSDYNFLEVYCDMTNDFGGWTFALKNDFSGNEMLTEERVGDISAKNVVKAKLSQNNLKNAIKNKRELLFKNGNDTWLITYESDEDINKMSFVEPKSYNLKIKKIGGNLESPFFISSPEFVLFTGLTADFEAPYSCKGYIDAISYGKRIFAEERFLSKCIDNQTDGTPSVFKTGNLGYKNGIEIWVR